MAVSGVRYGNTEAGAILSTRESILRGPYPMDDVSVQRVRPDDDAGPGGAGGFRVLVSGRLTRADQRPVDAARDIARQCFLSMDASRDAGDSRVLPLSRVEVSIRGAEEASEPAVVRLSRAEYLKPPARTPPSVPSPTRGAAPEPAAGPKTP